MLEILTWIINLGAIVFLPIIIFIFGVILRVKPGKALISGITVGLGFIGLNMVVDILVHGLGQAVQLMGQNYDLSLKVMDIGSGLGSPLAYSTTLGLVAIPTSIILNLIFILLGLTKTLNIDIWNFWYPIFNGLMAIQITDNFWIGYTTIVVCFLLQWLMTDIFQERISKFFGVPGIAISHMMSLSGAVIAVPLNWIFDRIPVLNKLDANPDTIKKRFGIFGDTVVMALIIGIVVGILANYDVAGTLKLGMYTAAVMKLMPKMVALFMEGLLPIAEAAKEFANEKLGGKQVNIGMDAAVVVGHPAVMATGLVLVPLSLLFAMILPGNNVLPFGDIAFFPFAICLMVPIFKGNMIRSIIGGALYLCTMIYISSWIAPLFTKVLLAANYDVGAVGMVTSIMCGLWPVAIVTLTFETIGWVALPLFAIVVIALMFKFNKNVAIVTKK